jgi:hypothetical protein
MRRIAIALLHHPVLDAKKAIVTTAITNLDVHDLARSARTFGCTDYFIVHPVEAQRDLVQRICDHWREGSSGKRIPDRIEALARIRPVASIADAYAMLGGRDKVEVWVTAARAVRDTLDWDGARKRLNSAENDAKTILVVFGTGWGLAQSIIDEADAALPPIRAQEVADYNHLSVRAACAIALDRLLGDRA